MRRAEVDRLLANHRANEGRCKHLEAEIKRLEAELEREKRDIAAEAVASATAPRVLDGMPHERGISKPTERLGIALADGWIPTHMRDLMDDIDADRRELARRELERAFVSAWLDGLPDRERWIIQQQVIDHVYWRDVAARYALVWGVDYSIDTLKRIKARALGMIYAIVEDERHTSAGA